MKVRNLLAVGLAALGLAALAPLATADTFSTFCTNKTLAPSKACIDTANHSDLIDVTAVPNDGRAACVGVNSTSDPNLNLDIYHTCGPAGYSVNTGYLGYAGHGGTHNHSTTTGNFSGDIHWGP